MSLPNIHISSHPCLQAKLSQLRSQSTSPRETRALVDDITSILGVEAFAKGLTLTKTGTVRPDGFQIFRAQSSDQSSQLGTD